MFRREGTGHENMFQIQIHRMVGMGAQEVSLILKYFPLENIAFIYYSLCTNHFLCIHNGSEEWEMGSSEEHKVG